MGNQPFNDHLGKDNNREPQNPLAKYFESLLQTNSGSFASNEAGLLGGIRFLLHEAGINSHRPDPKEMNSTKGKYVYHAFECKIRNDYFIIYVVIKSQNIHVMSMDQNDDIQTVCDDVFDIAWLIHSYKK